MDIDGEAAGDRFGESVSLSSDGNTMAVSAARNGGTAAYAGHVRLYSWNGSIWIQKGADIDGEAGLDFFGISVALNADGNTVVIGGEGNDDSSTDAGHARVFSWDGANWIQKGIDIDGEFVGDNSGHSVSITADGNTIAIGANNADYIGFPSGTDAGHVRVYNWSGAAWVQQGIDIDGEVGGDESASSMQISSDGSTVIIGAIFNDDPGQYGGHARVYGWDGLAWVQKGIDLDGDVAWDRYGYSVSINANGSVIAVTSRRTNNSQGHVRVFEWDGTSWVQNGLDIFGEAAQNSSGHATSLSADGNTIAIGAPFNTGNGTNAGHVRVYFWNGTVWSQVGADIDGEATMDRSGWAVSLTPDGSSVAIGANYNAAIGVEGGHVRVYQFCGSSGSVDVQSSCDSYTWTDGNTYTVSNSTAKDTISNVLGCDSIVTLDLTIYNSTIGTDLQTACDSYLWIDGNTYTASNSSATHLLTNSVGCDSLVTLDLTVNYSNSGSESINACDNYTWTANSTSYTASGSYVATIINSASCDSVATLNLTVNSSTSSSVNASACDSYDSPGGNTYTTTGTYVDVIANSAGCDSSITINLTIDNSSTNTEVVSDCFSYLWPENGITYTTSGIYNVVFQGVNGCDSTMSLDLTIDTVNTLVMINVLGGPPYVQSLSVGQTGATYQWLNCPSMTPISGATNQSFTATTNGDYAVEVTNGSCVDTSVCASVTTVGIVENNFGNKLLLYPNPTDGDFSIDLGESYQAVSISITDLSGKLIQSKKYHQCQLAYLNLEEPVGVYLLIIESGDKKAVIRLIKE